MKGILNVFAYCTAIFGGIGTVYFTFKASELDIEGLPIFIFLYFGISVTVVTVVFLAISEILDKQDRIMNKLGIIEESSDLPGSINNEETKDDSKDDNKIVDENEEIIPLFKNKTFANCPIIIKHAELVKKRDEVGLKLYLKNISQYDIGAIRIYIATANALGEIIDKAYEYMYMDLNVKPGQSFGDDTVIQLSSPTIRNIGLQIQTVLLGDKYKWEYDGTGMIDYIVNGFSPELYMDEIIKLNSSKEILNFLVNLGLDDEYLNEKVIPAIQTNAEVEKMYGNNKDKSIKKIMELYQISRN